MINAVGRDIPEEILEMTGKEVFQGNHYRDGYVYKKDGPYTKCVVNNTQSKLVANIHDVLIKCGIKDGMTLGFHHHFRDGDYIVNMVMEEVHKMGIKDITICASSLGKAHDPIVPYIEDGTITNIQSSGVRGKIGEAISAGKLKGLAIMRSHGGRVRAIESGETRIDIAFIGTPTCDDYGNCRGIGGKSDCGVLSYAMVDGDYADKVVAITDCLVPFPNFPAHISMTKVDYVVVVDDTLLETVDVTAGLKETGAIVINTVKDADYLKKALKGYKGGIYCIDARKVSEEALGRYFPNTPMLAAIVKVANIMDEKDFLNDMKGSFKHKFAKKPEVIEGNMKALEMALNEVKKIN